MRQKIIIMSTLMWSIADASLPHFKPIPLEPAEILRVEDTEGQVIWDRVFDTAVEELSSPVYKNFKQRLYNLSKDFDSMFYKAKVAELFYEVHSTMYSAYINAYRVLINFIPNPTEIDRFHILQALSKAPLTSHFPYPPFVDFCREFQSPKYSFSLTVHMLSPISPYKWIEFKKYASMIPEYKTEVAFILSNIDDSRWKCVTKTIVEYIKNQPNFFSNVELDDFIVHLKKTKDNDIFQLLDSLKPCIFERTPCLMGSKL